MVLGGGVTSLETSRNELPSGGCRGSVHIECMGPSVADVRGLSPPQPGRILKYSEHCLHRRIFSGCGCENPRDGLQ